MTSNSEQPNTEQVHLSANGNQAVCVVNAAALRLAEVVLSMDTFTNKGSVAKGLARDVLGIEKVAGHAPPLTAITTNGTTRLIPRDEPVFLLRGQDKHAATAVRCWALMVENAEGPASEIAKVARDHADKMDAWPKKKEPDLPTAKGQA